jgi:hypothetical protein
VFQIQILLLAGAYQAAPLEHFPGSHGVENHPVMPQRNGQELKFRWRYSLSRYSSFRFVASIAVAVTVPTEKSQALSE